MTAPKRNEAVAIKRYDPVNGYDSTMRSCGGLEENRFGVAVRYSDHVAVVAALQGEVSRLRELATELHEAVFFAQPFVEYAAKNAADPKLAQQCCDAIKAARESFTNLEPPTDGR